MVTAVRTRNVSLQSADLCPDPKHSLLCSVALCSVCVVTVGTLAAADISSESLRRHARE
jgi:hypothetical protein